MSKNDNVRKASSLKAVKTLTKKRLRVLLDEYVFKDSFRYYNVIHWLDFGVSMPIDLTMPAVEKAICALRDDA